MEHGHVIGANTDRARMRYGSHLEFLGAMFRPGRVGPFVGVPADELAGRSFGRRDPGDLRARPGNRVESKRRLG